MNNHLSVNNYLYAIDSICYFTYIVNLNAYLIMIDISKHAIPFPFKYKCKYNSKYKQTNLKENLPKYQTSEQENIRVPFVKRVLRIICDHSFFPYKSAKMRIDSGVCKKYEVGSKRHAYMHLCGNRNTINFFGSNYKPIVLRSTTENIM